ncbi:GON-4 [Labeo rohita]|uniref:GON-4-like protein n=1 Tax=Labeo rohita TaxID=84645 RepID=A0A498NFI7_LABRO|nr:GON-4 [Labeo rohita]
MGWKRKSSSPEPQPNPAKAPKKESISRSPFPLKLSPSSWRRKVSTPTKSKSWTSIQTLSPDRNVQQSDCNEQNSSTGHGENDSDSVQSSSPISSPLQSEEDAELGLVITVDEDRCEGEEWLKKRNGVNVKKSGMTQAEGEIPEKNGEMEKTSEELEEEDESEEELRRLDRDLTLKSKKLKLSSVNVRNIIHEVVTNEHVVAMMKAAIRDTQDMPMFEPKMTRSKLREVVEKGVGMGNWNISPIKKPSEIKPPQFVDIPLEEEEDSSDEEYCPDEDEEDETAEETFLESDVESTASSPRGSRRSSSHTPPRCDDASNSPRLKPKLSRHLRVEAVPMGPPAPPPQSCGPSRSLRAPPDPFIEKLHAVDKELELSPLCMEPYQALSNGGGGEPDDSLVACRTRSKRPLRDVPLDQLEAELCAPDITPDMYDNVSTPEDREWTQWLQGLMTSNLDNEEEADEEDDPEYNFLDDLDEPDLEDYRNDRAVRITKKEVNELMEELFETTQDTEWTLQSYMFEEPLAHMLTACRRTVKEQLDALQQRRENQVRTTQHASGPGMVLVQPSCPLVVTSSQKIQLQQQIQQGELLTFAEQAEEGRSAINPGFRSMFRTCNLQSSLNLLEELKQCPSPLYLPPKPIRPNSARSYPLLPAGLAWLFATRSVFLYPELLPHCRLDPVLHPPRSKHYYSKGEDGLLVLGLKHFAQTEFPYHLMSRYLIRPKRQEQLRVRVKDMVAPRAPHNIVKFYCQNRVLPPLPVMCRPVVPGEERPPVEREQDVMPNWLKKSLPHIHRAVCQSTLKGTSTTKSPTLVFPKGTRYPQFLPKGVTLRLHPSQRPIRPSQPKSRPLHGFARPTLAPLAKAPQCPTGSGNVLTNVSTPLPAHGVILLTQAPSTPINGVFPLVQPPLTPAHGTVPLNTSCPVNFQYVTPELGVGNPAHPPANLPPNVVQIPPRDIPLLNTGTVRTCGMQQTSNKHKKRTMPRKLAPLKPAPRLLPLSSGSMGNVSNLAMTMDQPISLNVTQNFPSDNVIVIKANENAATQRLVTSPSQDLVIQLVPGTQAFENTSNSYTGKTTKRSQCDSLQTMKDVTPIQYNVENGQRTVFSPLTAAPAADSSQFVLVQTVSSTGVPQFVLLPQDSIILNQPTPLPAEGTPGSLSQQTNCSDIPTGSIVLNNKGRTEVLLNITPATRGEDAGERKEEVEEMVGDRWEEEMAGALFGSPLLALSESSCSPGSSLTSTDGGAEASVRVEMDPVECPTVQSASGRQETPELRKHSTGDGKDQQSSGGENQSSGNEEGRGKERETSEESVLSVPELQETMEKLTWLASERRLCREGDSEEDNSPTSPTSPTSPNSQNSPASQNSQEENSEDEDDGAMKGDEMEAGEGEGGKLPEGETLPGDDPPQISGRGGGRGRGRGRPPPRSLKRGRRQERGSKDASKLLLLYDDHILDNDPMRESKDMAFAQAYLNRVREVLQDIPGKVEEFLGLLYEFDQGGESRSVVELFSQLKLLLKDWPDLLKDFAAFLLPEQALECGLFEEQQAFERSRRFLRQLEISFGENPSHYQKIVRALQSGSPLSPAGIEELKAQMATLLKGHTHLQGEFWMFFDEMRPPPARPGQFEEAVWPEDVGTGTDGEAGMSVGSRGGVWGGFEEVTLPDLEEDEESHKIRQISSRSRRRKEMRTHGNYKDCDWPEKDCSCPCHDSSHDAKHRRHKRKGCLRYGDGPVWEGGERPPSPVPEEQNVQNKDDERTEEERHHTTAQKHSRDEDQDTSAEPGESDATQQSTLSPALDTPVCAKNISLTPSGERVILWTREADRVILTACQQQGANQSTFQAVSEQLGNKTASEVSRRFRDLMRLFHTSASQGSSEDEAAEQQSATDEEQD